MNLDSLITVGGLIVAVYAIIPRVRRLEISLRFGVFAWIVMLTAITAILYLQFYQTFRTLGLTPGLNLSRWSITTSNASFIILLCMTLVLYYHLRLKGLSKSNVARFREFVFELSREKKYSEQFSLIERNINQLERVYNAEFIGSRLREYFHRNSSEFQVFQNYTGKEDDNNKLRYPFIYKKLNAFRKGAYKQLANILPSHEREKDVAKEIIHEMLINRNTVKAISFLRPYFALCFLEKNFYENDEFIDAYLRYLAEDTESILYHEIRNNQNFNYRNGYELPKRNRLLNFLFEDSRIAKRYAPYSPIGEFVINELDDLYSRNTPDRYNEPMGDFYEHGQWESKLLVGIRFFDIMVTSALYQNITWHMWLYYYPYFVKRIIRNLNPNKKLVDPSDEWPTRYHYALYEITSCLCKWASSIEHIPLDQENVVLETTSAVHENGNIPKSSILALGQITNYILTSDEVSNRFKRYILHIVYRQYFDLRKMDETRPYAEALINAIRCGGLQMLDVTREYRELLLDTFEDFDRIPYKIELSEELRAILENDLDKR